MKRLLSVAAVVAVLGVTAVMVRGAVTSAQEGEGPLGTFVEKLAAKLGIGEDELKTAIEETQSEMIDEEVAAGRLTEEQAERLKERVGEGDFGFPFGGLGHGPGHGVWGAGVTPEVIAEALGITQDQLMEELSGGKSLAEVAEGQGMSVDEFSEALLSQVKVQLDALVGEGELTQEQADAMLERIEENMDGIVSGQGVPGGFGGPGRGPGGFGFGGWWQGPLPNEAADSTEASEVTA
jgi:polyhydroxyalkanoate synthesis regulator phasin